MAKKLFIAQHLYWGKFVAVYANNETEVLRVLAAQEIFDSKGRNLDDEDRQLIAEGKVEKVLDAIIAHGEHTEEWWEVYEEAHHENKPLDYTAALPKCIQKLKKDYANESTEREGSSIQESQSRRIKRLRDHISRV